MLRKWQTWVLLILFFGPYAVYIGFGALWLYQKGWGLIAFSAWLAATLVFGVLISRWTRARQPVLPPLDWTAPDSFSPLDRTAWAFVEEVSERAESLDMAALTSVDLYVATGRDLANRLAAHYQPKATDPVEHVPVAELLTALELAADDLGGLCREVPGGDMVTLAHWKKAVQAAGYVQKASDLYGMILPIFQPLTGLARLGTQRLMVQPAWRNMRHNALRWFFRAFVNRLGTHLIELYSGRLAIGAARYRRLASEENAGRRNQENVAEPLVVAIVGTRGAGGGSLIERLRAASAAEIQRLRARVGPVRRGLGIIGRLEDLRYVEATVAADTTSPRDRDKQFAIALDAAVNSDILLLAIDGRRDAYPREQELLKSWREWFEARPTLEPPPIVLVVTGIERPAETGPTPDGLNSAVRDRVESVRAALLRERCPIIAVDVNSPAPEAITDQLLPALASALPHAERTAMKRQLYQLSQRSKASRLLGQVGRQGRRLFSGVFRRTPPNADAARSRG